jgi:hypothetical protein
MLATKMGTESRMVGMPSVWQARFTGCWWLEAYCAIHCSLVRRPNMAKKSYTRLVAAWHDS